MEKEKPDIVLRPETYENLCHYAKILKLPPEMIVEQALDAFFAEVNRQLGERNRFDDSAQTNLSFDEFWDGVDV